MAPKDRYLVGLDVGTSHVCAVVGEVLDNSSLDIVGIAGGRTRSIRAGGRAGGPRRPDRLRFRGRFPFGEIDSPPGGLVARQRSHDRVRWDDDPELPPARGGAHVFGGYDRPGHARAPAVDFPARSVRSFRASRPADPASRPADRAARQRATISAAAR